MGQYIARYAAGCAVTRQDTILIISSFPPHLSILSVELHALYLAIQHFATYRPNEMSCFKFTDQKNLSVCVPTHEHELQQVRIARVPGHEGIVGNELADTAARQERVP